MHICIEELKTGEVDIVIREVPNHSLLTLLKMNFKKILKLCSFRRIKEGGIDRQRMSRMIDIAIENLRRAKRNVEDQNLKFRRLHLA